MIAYTSNNVNKWGLVPSGENIRYTRKAQPSKGLGCLIGLLALVLIVLVLLVAFSQPYSGQNAGFAWNWGGIELRGDPGVFVCSASPLAPLFPSLVTDC